MASFRIQGRIDGLQGLLGKLAEAGKNVQKKGCRKAVGAAGKIILWDARARVRRVSGLLAKSLGRKVKVYRGSGIAVAIVGPRKGFRQEVTRDGEQVISDPVRYAHLVERGTSHSQPMPFLEPALKENVERIQSEMASAIASVLPGGG